MFADLDGVITTVNTAFLAMWGYTESSEVVGRACIELWADAADAARQLAQVETSGHARGELRARRRDGTTFVVRFVSSVVRGHRGVALGSIAEFAAPTDRIGSRRQTEAQHRALTAIIDASPDWIFAKDLEHRLTLTNGCCLLVRPHDGKGTVRPFHRQRRRFRRHRSRTGGCAM